MSEMSLHTDNNPRSGLSASVQREVERLVGEAVNKRLEQLGLNWVGRDVARRVLGSRGKPIAIRTLQNYRDRKEDTGIVFRPVGNTFEYYLPSLEEFKNRRAGITNNNH